MNSGQRKPNFKLGKSFDDICRELKCDRNTCEEIFSKLYLNEEVKYTNVTWKGLYLTKNGLNSYASKKYLKENNSIVFGWFKVFTQIVVPIMSLMIAVLALTLKFDSITEKIETKVNEKNTQEFIRIESKLDSVIESVKKK